MGERMQDLDLLLEVARMYYEQDMTQQEIANKIYVSRSRVSRMLKKAKALGLVEIIIKPLFESHVSLEKRLTERFGLNKVLVAYSESSGIQEEFQNVCSMGASYLASILDDSSVLAVSKGKTVATSVESLKPPRTYPDMQVVQLTGSLERISNPNIDEMYIGQRVATLYGCKLKRLLVPYLMDDEESKRLICKHAMTMETILQGKEVNTFISGVDTLLYWVDHLNEKEINILMKQGAVGCMWGYFFDINGNIIESPLYDRMIIPDRSLFATVDTRICIACDRFKARAILGALRSGLCNVLVTSSKIANQLLTLDSSDHGDNRV